MSLNSAAIATGVAALTVAGVTIKNTTNIPRIVTVGECPIMIPSPDGWMAGGLGQLGPNTFGPGMWEFSRAFTYLYLHAATGQKPELSDHIGAMADKVDLILTALTGLDVADADVESIECSGSAQITDPTGNSFFGCQITLTMKERVNA